MIQRGSRSDRVEAFRIRWGHVNVGSETVRGVGGRGGPRWLVLVCALAGCFRDEGPGLLCDATGCGSGTSSTTATTATTTMTPTSATEVSGSTSASGSGTIGDTTGAPVDTGITMRLDTMKFADPHLFLADTADPDVPTCTADITDAVNGVLSDDIAGGGVNLLLRFEDFPTRKEVRVIDAACEPGDTPDAPRVCTPNDASPAVILGLEMVAEQACRKIDPAVYAAENVPLINDPLQPCLRTKRAAFSLAVGGSIGALELREAQFAATLDDALTPTKLVNGVLYGFLPKVSAETLMFDIPLFGTVTLWSVIDVPACVGMYPNLLPSMDTLKLNDVEAPGVWLAINFTAELVVYQPSS